MQLELDKNEITLIENILSARLAELRVEVRRSDDPQFHDDLLETERRLRKVLEKVGRLDHSA